MSCKHTRACGAHGSTVELMSSSIDFFLPHLWDFSLPVGVVLPLSIDMSQGFLIHRLYG